jgi:hypothetical protein
MADQVKAVRLAIKLESALHTMKRLHGAKWSEKAAPYRAVLSGVMGDEGCSVLSAALPIAKDMRANGHSPVMLLAVAAEMIGEGPPGPVDHRRCS